MENIFDLKGISKTFGEEKETLVHALKHVDLKIKKGEFAALIGPSGSGKTTLLNLMSGLDNPTSGSVILKGKDLFSMSGNDLSDFRRDHIGFVFQSYNLIPVLTAFENIEYILILQGVSDIERKERVTKALDQVGLHGLGNKFPAHLSGGQQQRVAVARAMVGNPDIILADEPTANLDSVNGHALIDMMLHLNETQGVTFVFSTHDQRIIDEAKRIITIEDGKIVEDKTL
jgi:putative ABC transport system ATP-binding protein